MKVIGRESEMELSVRKYLEVKNITKAILFSLEHLLSSYEWLPFLWSIQNLLIEKKIKIKIEE